jgi:hypothetical protein
MHSPWHADPERAPQAIYKHSATPPETPPLRAGNELVSNRKPLQSSNEAVKMQEVAS